MYPAGTPFWVGYGFAADPEGGPASTSASTRFELDVDGEPVSMLSDVHAEAGYRAEDEHRGVPRRAPGGWHDFAGRWYDGGRLILSSRAAIEFVDR